MLRPIKEAADLFPPGSIGHRVAEWIGYLTGCNSKIMDGPVEDVPVEFDRFWFVGCENDTVFYRIGAIVKRDTDRSEKVLAKSLLAAVDKIPSVQVDEMKLLVSLAAHQVTRQVACLALILGRRLKDGEEVTLLCFSPAFELNEAIALLKETADLARERLSE